MVNNQNEAEQQGNSQEQSNGGAGVNSFTEEQLARKVKCRTQEGEVVEVLWHLMVQSKTFLNMWENLGAEETFDQDNAEPFVFPLNEITTICFNKIVEWMENHNGQPEPVVKEDPITTERIWFTLTDWEHSFFDVDFETVKEYFVAANFLDLKSLYLYCAQECARAIMDKQPEEIREMLCLPDDMTEEEKEALRVEFEIQDPAGGAQPDAGNAAGQPAAANGNDGQPANNA